MSHTAHIKHVPKLFLIKRALISVTAYMTPKYLPLVIAALIAVGAPLPAAEQNSTLNTILDAGRDYGEYKAREKARKEREERRERDRARQRRDNHYERHSGRNHHDRNEHPYRYN
jgi:hypothetical protein